MTNLDRPRGKTHRETYRGREIVMTRAPGCRRWGWLDHEAGEGFGFDILAEGVAFARQRIDLYVSSTVAFIWSHRDKRYLGINVNPAGVSLIPQGAPHAFHSVEHAAECLNTETLPGNSWLGSPMRGDYRADHCIVVEVQLKPQETNG